MSAEDRIREYLDLTEETNHGDLIDEARVVSQTPSGHSYLKPIAELNRTDLRDLLNEVEALRRGESKWHERPTITEQGRHKADERNRGIWAQVKRNLGL